MKKETLMTFTLLWTLLAAGSAEASTINLNPGSCMDIPTYITNDPTDLNRYTFYNITICAVREVCSFDLSLGPNTTYSNTTSPCSVRVSTPVAEKCNIKTSLPTNHTYKNTEGVCNVDIETEEKVCPSYTRPQPDFCEIDKIIRPQTDNVTLYENKNGTCRVDLTIDACPMPDVFQRPDNYSLVSDERIRKLTETAELGLLASQQALGWSINLTDCELKRASCDLRKKDDCPLTEDVLVNGWEQLPNMAKDGLDVFTRLNGSVNMWQFSQMVYPMSEFPEEAAWYAWWMLEEYTRVGYADALCELVYYEKYDVNMSECYYTPIITTQCLNKTARIVKIKEAGMFVGGFTATTAGVIILIISVTALFISAKKGALPWR